MQKSPPKADQPLAEKFKMQKFRIWGLVIGICMVGLLTGCQASTSSSGSSGGGGSETGPGTLSLLAALKNVSNSSIVFNAIAFGNDGYMFLGGSTTSTIEGDSNAYLGGDFDAFVAKYDSSGTRIWTKGFGTASKDKCLGITVDSNN
ncbi:MAG: hypothetical protein HY979_03070, partial [Candidatus Magasanikbacteria bacterium]|nr:hypothetical protein [Candidatus Magasanikbacteria bacterium]